MKFDYAFPYYNTFVPVQLVSNAFYDAKINFDVMNNTLIIHRGRYGNVESYPDVYAFDLAEPLDAKEADEALGHLDSFEIAPRKQSVYSWKTLWNAIRCAQEILTEAPQRNAR